MPQITSKSRAVGKNQHKYNRRQTKYVSPGFCDRCRPFGENHTIQGHSQRSCRNPPFCWLHTMVGHAPTAKCETFCNHCMGPGHSMRFCRKIKVCNLCGQFGHNPFSCWKYSTISDWMKRAKELNRCAECLTLFSKGDYMCAHCGTPRGYWIPTNITWKDNQKETQTSPDICIDQELHAELRQAETMVNEQKMQIADLNNKLLVLEEKLENYALAYNNVNSQLQIMTEQKELALQTTISLQNTLLDQHVEMNKLLTDNKQKDLQLEQHKQINNQFSSVISANTFCVDSIQRRDTTGFREYPRFYFRPIIGDLDTGQFFVNYNKYKQS